MCTHVLTPTDTRTHLHSLTHTDGTLHHIGEELRRITSSSHTALHEMAVDSSRDGHGKRSGNGNGNGMTNNHSGSFLRSRNHHHHLEEEKRTSVSPLLDGGMEVGGIRRLAVHVCAYE